MIGTASKLFLNWAYSSFLTVKCRSFFNYSGKGLFIIDQYSVNDEVIVTFALVCIQALLTSQRRETAHMMQLLIEPAKLCCAFLCECETRTQRV